MGSLTQIITVITLITLAVYMQAAVAWQDSFDQCQPDEFACHDDKYMCLPQDVVCNDIPECGDGSDELNCPNTFQDQDGQFDSDIHHPPPPDSSFQCLPDEFACHDDPQMCLSQKEVCNGVSECSDGSDELKANCAPQRGTFQCQADEFTCHFEQKCLKQGQVCDSRTDCGDGSDEINCDSTQSAAFDEFDDDSTTGKSSSCTFPSVNSAVCKEDLFGISPKSSLTDMTFKNVPFNDIERLFNAPQYQYLPSQLTKMTITQTDDINFNMFIQVKFHNLRELIVTNNLGVRNVRAMETYFPNLVTLSLRGNSIQDQDINRYAFAYSSNLQTINLANNSLQRLPKLNDNTKKVCIGLNPLACDSEFMCQAQANSPQSQVRVCEGTAVCRPPARMVEWSEREDIPDQGAVVHWDTWCEYKDSKVIMCEKADTAKYPMAVSCLPVTCSAAAVPSSMYRGTVKGVAGVYRYKSSVHFTCDKGFHMGGHSMTMTDMSLTCQRTGSWSGDFPTCKVVRCPNPGTISHGSVSGSVDGYSYQSSVTIKCNEGAHIKGQSLLKKRQSLTCQLDGSWDGDVPSCVRSCPRPQSKYAHTTLTGSGTSYPVGSQIRYTCKNGHYMPGIKRLQTTMTCGRSLSWEGTAPKDCVPVQCPQVKWRFPNGAAWDARGKTFTFGMGVRFMCDRGYQTSSGGENKYIQCVKNGDFTGRWHPDGHPPTCSKPNNQYRGYRRPSFGSYRFG